MKSKVSMKGKVKRADAAYKKAAKTSKPGSGKRFATLSKSIQAEGKSKASADAIAASIGRKKYGAKRFAKMGAAAKK